MAIQTYKLAMAFDTLRLQADLAALAGETWVGHFNQGYYEGRWDGLVLRGPVGGDGSLVSTGDLFEDAPLLDRAPYLRTVLEAFKAPLRSVRLLQLDPGSRILEHRDYDLGYDQGQVRIHVPVLTNPDVEFHLAGKRVVMGEGEVWYLDLSRPHRVANRGATPRMHLVIDLELNDWLRAQIPFETPEPQPVLPPPEPGDPPEHLERFRALVARSPEIERHLVDIRDRALFSEEVVRLAAEVGLRFGPGEIDAAMRDSYFEWNVQWMR